MPSSGRRVARPAPRRKERSGRDAEAWKPGCQDWALCLVFTAVLAAAAGLYSLHVLLGATELADANGRIPARITRQLDVSRSAGEADDFQRLYDAPGSKPELSAKDIAQPVQDSKVDPPTKQSSEFLPKGKGGARALQNVPHLLSEKGATQKLQDIPQTALPKQEAISQPSFAQNLRRPTAFPPAQNPELDLAVPDQAIEQLCTPAKIRGLVAMLTEKLRATVSADKDKATQAEQTMEAMERAAQAWTRLLEFKFQVEYMRNRICSRMEYWFTTLAELQPPWVPRQLSGNLPKALVWPHAAYVHFGVRRVWSLGEYSQWADLCAGLASLGFEVVLWRFRQGKFFPSEGNYQEADIVFTDYNGVHAGKSVHVLPPGDLTWLLDTFGTDGTIVGNDFFGRIPPLTDYPLHRFLTLVPGFAERNTFLGVAAVAGKANKLPADSAKQLPARKWQCVLWSKVHPWLREKNGFPAYHWKLLREYTKHCKVIATIDKKDTYKTEELIRECCPEVEIRGVESPSGFLELLRSSAVYVGVGEPLIAPSCFEALSLGTHVVQPRFPQPRVLPNKPITQAWTSQHPFLEKVPEPFAFTVDPLDFSALAVTFGKLRAYHESIYGSSEGAATAHPVSQEERLALHEFYAIGDYPGREEFSIGGFLKRVANIAKNTKALQAKDWDWELQQHPEQLPALARGGGGK
eukprot:TRINITY_DN29782_c0_g1_i1.p1 TRINITY_DN29782_c0_g1~~TRINITY_DN29782_c0_g1_i1.p1  ORF type:complete len:691 (-),score=134.75 TRINITY_DN29782_c0_g1_i1:314-2386(-)